MIAASIATSLPRARRLSRAFAGAILALLLVGCMGKTEGGQIARHSREQPLVASDMRTTVRRVGSVVEVQVTAPDPFPDRAMPPVIIIGDKAFRRSRPPPDGRPDTLIFTIDAREFDALPGDADVIVGYLSSAARLPPPEPPSASANGAKAPQAEPVVRPDQVQANGRRVLGTFRKSQQEIVP